jgi:hypothetical protein
MSRTDGAQARTLDVGEATTTVSAPVYGKPHAGLRRPDQRMPDFHHGLPGPGKYAVLEHRRRQAQIKARRLLDLFDMADSGREGT